MSEESAVSYQHLQTGYLGNLFREECDSVNVFSNNPDWRKAVKAERLGLV